MPIFERIAWDQVRQYYAHSSTEELIIYSHHETVDALSVMGFLSRYAKGVILLMQLDVKSFIAKSILHNIRSKLLGVLAVSPQPIIESPFITSITRNLRILIPALALDPVLYTIDKSESRVERYSAVYFGRLSREKGLVDLLRAWSIISQREPRARLTLIGMPENHEILTIISKYITKHRNVEYLGYLPTEKLYREVVKHHVLIYPSYRDAFPFTVLEALALGLGVVAYDIPVIRYMYTRSSMVYVVKKGDIISLAEGAINWFNRNIEHDEYTKTLIKLYSSWEKVAKAEAQAILLLSRP
jgi:glycosyltransferase involved in cell wall biosynthesis